MLQSSTSDFLVPSIPLGQSLPSYTVSNRASSSRLPVLAARVAQPSPSSPAETGCRGKQPQNSVLHTQSGAGSLWIRCRIPWDSHLFSVFYWSNYSQGIGSSCPVEIRIPQSTFIWFPVLGLLLFFYFNLFAVCLICAWGVGNSSFDCG